MLLRSRSCSWGLCAVGPSQSQQSICREERQCWFMQDGDFTWHIFGYPRVLQRSLGNEGGLSTCWAWLSSPCFAPGDDRLGTDAGFLPGADGGKTSPMSWQLLSKGSSIGPGRPEWVCGAEYHHDHPARGEGDSSLPLPSCSPQTSPGALQPGGLLMPYLLPQGSTGSLCSWAGACLGAGGRGQPGVGWRNPAIC